MTHKVQIALWAASAVWLAALSYLLPSFLVRIGLAKPNFRGRKIPVAYGLLIPLWSVPILAAVALREPSLRHPYVAMLVVVLGFGALGLIDDIWGDRRRSGLLGHFRAVASRGEVSTGFIKAVGGGIIAVAVPRFVLKTSWPDAIVDGAIIALSANAVNLLDLRPGRACALFLAAAIGLAAAAGKALPLLYVIVPAIPIYERDARAAVMMGDTGSNALGGALGLAFVLAAPAGWSGAVRLSFLIALVAFHVLTERVSLTAVIDRNPLLRRIDRFTGVR